jgi:mono/diheme cytochrome c family protein
MRIAGPSLASSLFLLAGCPPPSPPPPGPEDLVGRGRQLFFNETFGGNGRTCGTCHRAEENMGLSPAFIATLPANDPLFVAETNPDLAQNFENPRLMRPFSLILENLDGFGDLPNKFVMRGIPHTLALRTSVASRVGPRTGWSGDGAPGDGSLRSFAVGAVIQHFTRTTNRVAGVDFRLPTDAELDALEAFQLSLGRQEDLTLPLPLKGVVPARGQAIFLDNTLGKCNACHFHAGANGNPAIFGAGAGNLNFNTGVENLPDQPADLAGEPNPPDDGFGTPGNGEFNTPPLVESADTPPFFHNNSVETIEGAVAFYDGESFNNSPAGQLLKGATGSGIELDATQIVAIAAFLRVLNALDNIDQSIARLRKTETGRHFFSADDLAIVAADIDDAIGVLAGAGLHAEAVRHLRDAREANRDAIKNNYRASALRDAIAALGRARAELTAAT